VTFMETLIHTMYDQVQVYSKLKWSHLGQLLIKIYGSNIYLSSIYSFSFSFIVMSGGILWHLHRLSAVTQQLCFGEKLTHS
jgi:hypothetical protein